MKIIKHLNTISLGLIVILVCTDIFFDKRLPEFWDLFYIISLSLLIILSIAIEVWLKIRKRKS